MDLRSAAGPRAPKQGSRALSAELAKTIGDVILENEKLFAEVTHLRRQCTEGETVRSELQDTISSMRDLLESAHTDRDEYENLKDLLVSKDEELQALREEKEDLSKTVRAFQERMEERTRNSPTPPPAAVATGPTRRGTIVGRDASMARDAGAAGGMNPAAMKELMNLKASAAQMAVSIKRLTLQGKPRDDFTNSIALNRALLEKLKSSVNRTAGEAARPEMEASGRTSPNSAAAAGGSGGMATAAVSPERDLAQGIVKELVLAACTVVGDLYDTVKDMLPAAGGAAAVPQTPRSTGGWLGLTQGGKK